MRVTNLRKTQIVTNDDTNAILSVNYVKGGMISDQEVQISTGEIDSTKSDKRHKIINIGRKARGHRLKLTVTGVVSKTQIGCITNMMIHDRLDTIDIDDMFEGTTTGLLLVDVATHLLIDSSGNRLRVVGA